MNVRLEEAERDGLVGEENANEKEKGKYKIHTCKIHKVKIQKVKIQTTRCKIQSKRMWRRTDSRGGEGGGRWRYCDSDDR